MESPESGIGILWHSDSVTQVSTEFSIRARNRRLQISGLGPEASEHAIVWKVYNAESAKADTALLDASHRSIDVLLIFTGLFSTVLTTFIVQVYQFLVQGPPPRNMAANPAMPVMEPTSTPMATDIAASTLSQPIISITPSTAALSMEQLQWVNILWFLSLAFSLCNAAVCMLGKQWLQPAGRNIYGSSPRFRARQRQRRYMQIRAWHILTVIDALPLFLHIGLLLFFAGLVILVWTVNHVIAIITGIIVIFVYVCYSGSMWLALAHADCPYQHPLSKKLRSWRTWSYNSFLSIFSAEKPAFRDIEKGRRNQHKPRKEYHGVPISIVKPEDSLDAYALIWLFKHCPNDVTTSISLQAIGDLPRNFTAFHILRQAGVISLVLRRFSDCFYKDLTLDSQWLILQPQDAGKYCQAWMRLTCGTSIKWPRELVNLLETLRKTANKEDISAIAECTRAVAFLDGSDGRSMIISSLNRHVTHRIHLSQETQCWLLETFLQFSLTLGSQFPPPNHIAKAMVPILLRLLHYNLGWDARASNVRSAAALCLSYMTGGTYDSILLNDESRRQEQFYDHLIPSFTIIIQDPGFFGVDEELLNQMAADFVHVAIQMSKGDFKDCNRFRSIAQLGLSKIYLQGRINNATSDEALSKILQIIFPPGLVASEDRPPFLKSLMQTLSRPAQSPILLGSALRLLEPLLSDAQPAVLDAFVESGGCTVLLNVADIGEVGSGALQLSCIRNICLFVQNAGYNHSDATSKARLNNIFQSPFLHTITTLLKNRSFWSPEIPLIWVPALLRLCKVRPYDNRWKNVEAALSKFIGHDGKHGYDKLKQGLDNIKALTSNNN